jgi:DNA-binding NarL/FixJ family response regulator
MTSEPIRIVLADDHPAFLEGVRALLSVASDIEIVAEAATGTEAVAAAAEHLPDVVVMDIKMPELNGIDATRTIVQASPHIGVLMLTMSEDAEPVFAAIRAGARGYLLKGAGRDDIIRAVRAVACGDAIYSPLIAQQIIAYFSAGVGRTAAPFPELTDREREVLELIASGQNNAVISRRLFISPKTVRNHISNIFSKLQVADRAQAIVRARQAGLGQSSASTSPR